MPIDSIDIASRTPAHGSWDPTMDPNGVDAVWSPSRAALTGSSDLARDPLLAYGGPPGGGGYGGPPGGGGYGGPPGAPPGGGGYGGPPGGPPGGYGGPPGGAPPGGYGGPAPNPYAAPQGAFGAAPMMGPMGMGGLGPRPTRRNALMTWLLPFGLMMAGNIFTRTGIMAMAAVGGVCFLVGLVVTLVYHIKMLSELAAVSQDPNFGWWPIFIPCYNIYYWVSMVPNQVTKAKQMAGLQAPTRSPVAYFFINLYALAADLNDLAG